LKVDIILLNKKMVKIKLFTLLQPKIRKKSSSPNRWCWGCTFHK